jgi:hypothetical protein
VAPPFSTKPIKPGQGATKSKRKAPRKPATGTDPATPSTKRKRVSQAKNPTTPAQIACFTCGQVDVPLIMGGRECFLVIFNHRDKLWFTGFCRPCVDAGKGMTEIPQAHGMGGYSYKFSATVPSDGGAPQQAQAPAALTTVTSDSNVPNISPDVKQSEDPPAPDSRSN